MKLEGLKVQKHDGAKFFRKILILGKKQKFVQNRFFVFCQKYKPLMSVLP